ncbi:lipase, partial [Helicobacter sp. MIT 14-3879]
MKEKDKQDKDSPNNLTHHLSPRTKFFTSRFKLLHHQPNTTSGFSATLFEDTQDNNQKILSIRGTEFPSGIFNDIAEADVSLALDSLPNHQYIDMLKFYCECVDKYPSLHKDNNLIIVGHSLGGALAQMLTLSLATPNSKGNIKEVYTFNSPGAKNLKPLNLDNVYEIDSTILS